MAELTEPGDYRGRFLCDANGERIGTIDDMYVDTDTGKPEWALVTTGEYGTEGSFVPIRDAVAVGDEDVRVPLSREKIHGAARIQPGEELSADQEDELYDHYGLDLMESHSGARPEGESGADTGGRGRLRLRRYVVTEHVQTTVPVQREEIRLEREDDVRP